MDASGCKEAGVKPSSTLNSNEKVHPHNIPPFDPPGHQQQLRYPHLHPWHPKNRPMPPARPLAPVDSASNHQQQQQRTKRKRPADQASSSSNFRHPFSYSERSYMHLKLYISILARLISDPVDELHCAFSVIIAWIASIWSVFVCAGGIILSNLASVIMMITMPRITLPQYPKRQPVSTSPPKISIIVPSLNDGASIVRTIIGSWQAMTTDSSTEIIVVDGGSTDATVSTVKRLSKGFKNGDPLGRRDQPGFKAGHGTFFHSVHLIEVIPHRSNKSNLITKPSAFDATIFDSLSRAPKSSQPSFVVGTFELATESSEPTLYPLTWAISYGSKLLNRPIHPAQSIFVSTEAFFYVGEFPDQPIFDTIEFVNRASRLGGHIHVLGGEPVLVLSEGGRSLGLNDEGWRMMGQKFNVKKQRLTERELAFPIGGDLNHGALRWSDMGFGKGDDSDPSGFGPGEDAFSPQTASFFPLGGPGARSAVSLAIGVLMYAYLGMTAESVHCFLTGTKPVERRILPSSFPPEGDFEKESHSTPQSPKFPQFSSNSPHAIPLNLDTSTPPSSNLRQRKSRTLAKSPPPITTNNDSNAATSTAADITTDRAPDLFSRTPSIPFCKQPGPLHPHTSRIPSIDAFTNTTRDAADPFAGPISETIQPLPSSNGPGGIPDRGSGPSGIPVENLIVPGPPKRQPSPPPPSFGTLCAASHHPEEILDLFD
ncbi:hypothetical protein HDU97_003781 [Phlyctochytrium planicorne]|nr:hypothetical protein HDU97_003781 [Phlyctochytrium planicorne]